MIALLASTALTPALADSRGSGKPPGPAAGMAGQTRSPRQEPPDEPADTKPLPEAAKQGFKNQKQADRKSQKVEEKASRITRGSSCDELRRDPAKRKGGAVCVEEREAPASAAATAAALPVWCDGGTALIQVTRFSLCSVRYWGVIVYNTDGSEFGTADITTAQEINTAPRASDFMEEFYMRVDRMDPALATVTVSANTECNYLSGCSDGGQDPWIGELPMPAPGTWWEGTVHRSWTGANGHDEILMLWTLTFTKPQSGKSSTVQWGGLDYELRCDDEIGGAAGCVVPSYTPTMVVDGATYPGARNYIGRAQASMSSHPGWLGMGEALHREADSSVQEENRRKVCYDGTWVKEDRFGGKASPDPDSIECDEFPFAATKESGGQSGISSGAECQQWTVWPGGSGSGWPATDYAVQAWTKSGTAQCARASMPRRQNGGVGTGLSNFYQNQRILDNEDFWLDSGAAGVYNHPGPVKAREAKSCSLKSPVFSEVTPGAAPQSAFLNYARTTPNGWTGGDSTYSVRLPDGRNLWLFSDTFLGPLNANGTRPTNAPLVNSSFVIQNGSNLTTITGGSAANPSAIMPNNDAGHWYWLGDGMIAERGGTKYLQVIFQEYYRFGDGLWDWGWHHSVLATFSLSDLNSPLSVVPLPSAAGVTWGSGILPSSKSGDGYTYIYGVDDAPTKKSMRVARVLGDDLNTRWEFLDPANNRWALDERRTSNTLTGVANEYSVTPWNGQFMLLTQDSNLAFNAQVYAYSSCDPAGGWYNQAEVYKMPETGLWGTYGDENIFAYNAHIHPQLHSDGTHFTFSYNVNTFDSRVSAEGSHYKDPSIYKPRWVSFAVHPNPCPPRC
ncbi:hypothetical protein OG800_01585 [Streptomyces sp. NBC_00445]|uniref:hypothetical protein n=1 Tax=unclassified Streptomyces TaxID=2593676 RepID=UPI002E21E363|nr:MULTISPECIES: hypothetical protein [unclassified Streptomyces]